MKLREFMRQIENMLKDGTSIDSEVSLLRSDMKICRDFSIVCLYDEQNGIKEKTVIHFMDDEALTNFQMKMVASGVRMDQ